MTNESFVHKNGFVLTAGGKVLFVAKTYSEIKEFIENPINCIAHMDLQCPNPKSCLGAKEYKHVKIHSDKFKIFFGIPIRILAFNFGHIWHQFYYRVFGFAEIYQQILKNCTFVMLGSDEEACFRPSDPYYKSFTEKISKDNGVEEVIFSDEPTIYEVNNFWANNHDVRPSDFVKFNKYFNDGSSAPKKKLYTSRSYFFGKRATPHYFRDEITATLDVNIEMQKMMQLPEKYIFADRGYDNFYQGFCEQNSLLKKIYNEDELSDFLTELGFEISDPMFKFHKKECIYSLYDNSYRDNIYKVIKCVGGCKIEDSIKYFQDVKLLMGVSASALQNMLFMDPIKSKVIELETKFYLVSGGDENKVLKEIANNLKYGIGYINQEVFSKKAEEFLPNTGETHDWHRHLAKKIGIDYHIVPNHDLNARTIIKKLKSQRDIMQILSE